MTEGSLMPPARARHPVSWFYRAAALVFAAYPIVVLATRRPDAVEVALVLAGVALFVGLLTFAARAPDSPARESLAGPALVILLLGVATALMLRDPNSGFYPFYYF